MSSHRGFTYATATPAKPCNLLSGVALIRPAHRVLGYTVCCAELGKANAYGRVNMRAAYKATAFRQINKARAQRRAALKAVAAAQDALLALAGA